MRQCNWTVYLQNVILNIMLTKLKMVIGFNIIYLYILLCRTQMALHQSLAKASEYNWCGAIVALSLSLAFVATLVRWLQWTLTTSFFFGSLTGKIKWLRFLIFQFTISDFLFYKKYCYELIWSWNLHVAEIPSPLLKWSS